MIVLEKNSIEFDKAKTLYKEVFCDGDSFVKTIMSTVSVASVDIENEEVVSCAFARNKQIRVEDKIIDVPFLFGVATKKDYRGQNRASKVINEILEYLKPLYDFVLLCPANIGLYDFYSRFGFEKLCFFNYKTKKIENGVKIKEGNVSDAKILAKLFNKYNQTEKVAQYRTPESMKIKLEEIVSDNGKIQKIIKNNKTIGYYLFDDIILESINANFKETTDGIKTVELSNIQEITDGCPGVVIKKFKDISIEHIKFYEMW